MCLLTLHFCTNGIGLEPGVAPSRRNFSRRQAILRDNSKIYYRCRSIEVSSCMHKQMELIKAIIINVIPEITSMKIGLKMIIPELHTKEYRGVSNVRGKKGTS